MSAMSLRWGIGAIAFLAGVTLGMTGGLLWAPQPGRRTREDLQDLATNAFDQVEHWGDTAKQSVNELLEKGKTSIQVG